MNEIALNAPAALTITGAAGIVAMMVQLTKSFVCGRMKSSDPRQNDVVRLYVAFVALVTVVGWNFLSTGIMSRAAVSTDLIAAFSVTTSALVGFHLLTGSNPMTPSVATISGLAPIQPLGPLSSSVTEPTPALILPESVAPPAK